MYVLLCHSAPPFSRLVHQTQFTLCAQEVHEVLYTEICGVSPTKILSENQRKVG